MSPSNPEQDIDLFSKDQHDAGHYSNESAVEESRSPEANTELPRVDHDGFLVIDGEKWGMAEAIAKQVGIANAAMVRARTDKIRTTEALGRGGKQTLIFNLNDAEEVLADFRTLPKIGQDGFYVDGNNEKWGLIEIIAQMMKVDRRSILKSEDIRTIEGLSRLNQKISFYNFDDAERKFGNLRNLPEANSEGIYTDESGQEWATVTAIAQEFKIGTMAVRRRRTQMNSIDGMFNGQKIELFNMADARSLLAKFEDRPIANSHGIYIDEAGEKWGSIATISDEIGVSQDMIRRRRSELRSQKVIHGALRDFYNISDAEKLFEVQKQLPQVNELGIYTDENGEPWCLKHVIVNSTSIPTKRINNYQIRTIAGRDTTGREAILYSLKDAQTESEKIEALPHADESGFYTDDQGERWGGVGEIAEQLGIDQNFIYDMTFRKLKGVNKNGRIADLYNLSDVKQRYEVRSNSPRVDSDGFYTDDQGERWGTAQAVADELKLTKSLIIKNKSSINTIPGLDSKNRLGVLYDLKGARDHFSELISLPRLNEEGLYVDENQDRWGTIDTVATVLGLTGNLVRSRRNQIESIDGTDRAQRPAKLYKLSSAYEILKEYVTLPKVGEDGFYVDDEGSWGLTSSISQKLNLSETLIAKKRAEIKNKQGIDRAGGICILLNEQSAKEVLNDYLVLPRVDEEGFYVDADGQKWGAQNKVAELAGVAPGTIFNRSHLIRFQRGIDKSGQIVRLFSLQDAIVSVEDITQSRVAKEIEVRISDEKNPIWNEVKEIVGVLGEVDCLDILYALLPEAREINPEKVKGLIAEFLGNYMAERKSYDIDALFKKLEQYPEINGIPSFRDLAFHAIKLSTLSIIRNVPTHDFDQVLDIVSEHLHQKRTEAESRGINDIAEIINRVESYWVEVLSEPHLDRMVENLKPERRFPDINQLINIHEILSQKRMLIADEMGLGKSASAIMSVETLKERSGSPVRTLIIVPSNTMPTWLKYLSSQTDESGNQAGYFKPGSEPTVVQVQSQIDLVEGNQNAEYVLISQERLNDEYESLLAELDFDFIIADEIHKLKNISSGVRSQSFLNLAGRLGSEKHLVMLSGTPIPNKVNDLAVYLKALYPEQFGAMETPELTNIIINGDLKELRALLLPRMQMKELAESIDVPELSHALVESELSQPERDIYEALLDDDEVEASTKIMILRRFLLNPDILGTVRDDGVESWSKNDRLKSELTADLGLHDRIVVFTNGYVEGVLRGGSTIFDQLDIPDSVEVDVVDGSTDQEKRQEVQSRLNSKSSRMVVFVSGQTADVGIDYSGADLVYFYNEPWSKYEKRQQTGRVWRYGQTDTVTEKTFVTNGTIEEGIHEYIEIKEKAIEKLLKGIPITDIEKQTLVADEKRVDENLEVNAELAKYYFSAWDRMLKIFSVVKNIGQEDFIDFLSRYGKEYADCYCQLGSRSYQANVNRVTSTIIGDITKSTEIDPDFLRILDLASGPEMLRQHSDQSLQDHIVSMDINPEHFTAEQNGQRVVGSIRELPFAEKSFDFTNLSLALHYTKYVPSRGNYERLSAIAEMNRVLKVGGHAIINNIYSLSLKDPAQFESLMNQLGFEIIHELSGESSSGNNFKVGTYVLRKTADVSIDIDNLPDDIKQNLDGLKLVANKDRVSNTRELIRDFSIHGKSRPVEFNEHDLKILEEEDRIRAEADTLIGQYGSIEQIPKEYLMSASFGRFYNGKRFVLFKKSLLGSGLVLIK